MRETMALALAMALAGCGGGGDETPDATIERCLGTWTTMYASTGGSCDMFCGAPPSLTFDVTGGPAAYTVTLADQTWTLTDDMVTPATDSCTTHVAMQLTTMPDQFTTAMWTITLDVTATDAVVTGGGSATCQYTIGGGGGNCTETLVLNGERAP